MTRRSLNSETPDREAIAALAYQLWQQRSCPPGSGEQDWYEAEALLRMAALRQDAATLETHATAPFAAASAAVPAPRKSPRAPKAEGAAAAAPRRTRVTRARPARPDA